MARTTLVVPVSYPLSEPSVQTITHAADLAARVENAELYILHVNLLQKGEAVTPTELKRAIEQKVGRLPNASYNVHRAFLLEEAILNEAGQQDADYVVVGQSLRGRWRQLLATRLGLSVDLEAFLRDHLDAELVIV